MTTLQDYLNEKYPVKKWVNIITIDKNLTELEKLFFKKLDGGELNLSEFTNLTEVIIMGNYLKSPLTSLDISNCPQLKKLWTPNNQLTSLSVINNKKLQELFIDLNLLDKIIGLDNTSIIRLDCWDTKQLQNNQDVNFIWNYFLNKYQLTFPEMKLIGIHDLTTLIQQVNQETIKDQQFLQQISKEGMTINQQSYHTIYRVIDQITNSIFARCLIIQNRLYASKDEAYERKLTELAHQTLKCRSMNPKYSLAAYYPHREKLIQQVLNGDSQLRAKLQDLPYYAIQ